MSLRKNLCAILVAVSLVFMSVTNSSAFVNGDVDDDGVVRLADALLVLRHAAGTQSLTSLQLFVCDVTGGGGPLPSPDGICFLDDSMLILEKSYGLIDF